MYHMEMVFRLSVSLKKIKKFMQECDMPYPILKDCIETTVSFDGLKEIPTKDEQKDMAKKAAEKLKTETDDVCVERVKYIRTSNVYKVEESEGPCDE